MKLKVLSLALLLSALFPLIFVPVFAPAGYGPRMDYLLINVSYDVVAEWTKMKGLEIDVMDWPLLPSQIAEWNADPNLQEKIRLVSVDDLGMREFDINCQRAPTDDVNFRRAIAHLVDKDTIILNILEGYAMRMDTPIPDPILKKYINKDVTGDNYPYPYDTSAAEDLFVAGGYISGYGAKDYISHTGLEPIILCARLDDPQRRDASFMLKTELEALLGSGSVEWVEADKSVLYPKVMAEFDYHIYSGGWGLSRDVDYIHDFYSSEFFRPWWYNYNGFTNATYDATADLLKYAPDGATVMWAVKECQAILIEQMPVIPIWASVGKTAYAKGWENVVNFEGVGPNNAYSWYDMTRSGYNTIKYGFKSDIEGLNMITSEWMWDHEVLGNVYESLLWGSPYILPIDMDGGIASDWDVGTWVDPDDGETKTKVTFNLREPSTLKWHPMQNGTALSPDHVTIDDVKFTFQYTYDQQGWWYSSVMDIKEESPGTLKIETPDSDTIVIYFNVLSYWALHWAGTLPIIPKQVWEPIDDAYAYDPEADDTVVGCNAWKYVSRVVGSSIRLDANRDYWHTPDYVHDIVDEAFHRWGDTNYDGEVWLLDYASVGMKFSLTPYSPAPTYLVDPDSTEAWDPLTSPRMPLTRTLCASGLWAPEDVDYDGKIFVKDLATVGAYWGKSKA